MIFICSLLEDFENLAIINSTGGNEKDYEYENKTLIKQSDVFTLL